MAIRIEEGWQVLSRTPSGRLHPCYFCSRTTPKFEVGWRVRLADGAVITVGPECGRTHLGPRFTIDKRAIEDAEAAVALEERRRAWLLLRPAIEGIASATINHEGLARLVRIKERTLQLGSSALKYLNAISEGVVRGVPRWRAFEHGNPRHQARTILRCFERLEGSIDDPRELAKVLRELSEAIDHHNSRVFDYAASAAAFEPAMIAQINSAMPAVEWAVHGGKLLLYRRLGSLSDELPLPQHLNLAKYPTPD